MGKSGRRMTCAAAGALYFLMIGSTAVVAGSRLYNMDRFLSEPHPFGQVQPIVSPPPPFESSVPLPGSSYTPVSRIQSRAARSAQTPGTAAPLKEQSTARNGKSKSWVSEIVVGGWIHDPGAGNTESDTWDLNLEIIFRKVEFLSFENRYLRFLFTPHPIFGGSVNNEDETHTAYLGMNWQYDFDNGLFVAGSLALAYHTGNLDQAEEQCPATTTCSLPGNRQFVNTGEVTLGSRILFRESLEFGYRLKQRHGISLYIAHMSNGGILDDDNDGMNFAGLRYRYSFD